MMKNFDIGIVGGGLAGLATAVRLSRAGKKVCLFEKNTSLGGKLTEYSWKDYRWDKGPSLFTMPHLVQEMLEDGAEFEFVRVSENCRYFFADKKRLKLTDNQDKNRTELLKFYNEKEVGEFDSYLKNAEKLYDGIGSRFIDYPKTSFGSFFRKDLIPVYPRLLSRQVLNSLHSNNTKQLNNDELIQLFNRFGTYNGSDPYHMSGLYQMVCSLELNKGTYFPLRGMRAIIAALETEAERAGVEVRLNQKNTKVDRAGELWQIASGGEKFYADKIVSAVDHLTFYRDVLDDQKSFRKYSTQERSSSGLVFYWAMDKKFDEIGLHNIFFSSDYRREFSTIFRDAEIPDDPTVYIHNSSFVCPDDAPEKGQNWFVMVNTPAGVEPSDEDLQMVRKAIIDQLKKHGIDAEPHVIHEHRWTMKGLLNDTGAVGGAIYGPSSNHKLAALKRHGNKVRKYKNLYFVGGTVHPGGGIPLVLKSTQIVEKLILNE